MSLWGGIRAPLDEDLVRPLSDRILILGEANNKSDDPQMRALFNFEGWQVPDQALGRTRAAA
jgi:hypothetical protein